jgi:hypothetical protein
VGGRGGRGTRLEDFLDRLGDFLSDTVTGDQSDLRGCLL